MDAAKGMVAMAKENAAASGLADRPIHWIVDDCGKFIQREIRRGRKYDGIIMDPPSYGRGPSGEIWKMEKDFLPLPSDRTGDPVRAAPVCNHQLLYHRIGPSHSGGYMADAVFGARFGGGTQCGNWVCRWPHPASFLPCGAAGRWEPGR